jgi:Uma2 family endonuclease
MAPRTLRDVVVYPESDGKPMGESDSHRKEMQHYAIEVLEQHFERDSRVYVSGNNFLYYTKGVPQDCVSPDAYVVKGVPKHERPIFKVWEEGGRVPSFVLEVTSKSTRREDLGDKMVKYRDELRVREYFLFDLTRDWLEEGLRGHILKGGDYLKIEPLPSGRLSSHELGLELGIANGHLRFYLPGAGEPIPTFAERAKQEAERAKQEAERAKLEAERAERAEAEIRRLKEELAQAKGRRKPRRR